MLLTAPVMTMRTTCKPAVALATLLLASCETPMGRWEPKDINDSGAIVGSQFADNNNHAVLYQDGALLRLPLLSYGIQENNATGINDEGTVVGNSGATAVLWDASHAVHDLGLLSGWPTYANAINNQGVIVGYAIERSTTGSSTTNHAWFRDPATARLSELPTLPGATQTSAVAVNDRGDIVGDIVDGSGYHAVKWLAGSHEVQILPTPAAAPCGFGCFDSASAINAAGAVIGVSNGKPVLWPVDRAPIVLSVGNHRTARPFAINDAGMIVGYVDDSNPDWSIVIAARWTADLTLQLLAQPALTRTVNGFPVYDNSYATTINNRGVVAGVHLSEAVIF